LALVKVNKYTHTHQFCERLKRAKAIDTKLVKEGRKNMKQKLGLQFHLPFSANDSLLV